METIPGSFPSPNQDSGRRINLSGDFRWWEGGATPSSAHGEYRVHPQSLARGVEVKRWQRGDDTWEIVNWHIWCWRRDIYDAVRIYLQLFLPPDGVPAVNYVKGKAFPTGIAFPGYLDECPTTTVRIEYSGSKPPECMAFSSPSYVWCQHYCRAHPCLEDVMDPEGYSNRQEIEPGSPFEEETQFAGSLSRHKLRETAASQAQERDETTAQLARARVAKASKDDQIAKLLKKLRLAEPLRAKHLITQVLPKLDSLDLKIWALNYEGKLQKEIGEFLGLSRNTVGTRLRRIRAMRLPVLTRGVQHSSLADDQDTE